MPGGGPFLDDALSGTGHSPGKSCFFLKPGPGERSCDRANVESGLPDPTKISHGNPDQSSRKFSELSRKARNRSTPSAKEAT